MFECFDETIEMAPSPTSKQQQKQQHRRRLEKAKARPPRVATVRAEEYVKKKLQQRAKRVTRNQNWCFVPSGVSGHGWNFGAIPSLFPRMSGLP